jgi:hypothetical protein
MRKLDDEYITSMSEKEAAALLAQIEALIKNYIFYAINMSNLKKILSAKKILKLKKSEDDFNRKLLQQYRDKAANNKE